MKKLYYLGGVAIVFIFLLIQVYFYFNPTTLKDLNNPVYLKIKEKEIKAIIKRYSIDCTNHCTPYIVYGKDSIPSILDWEIRAKEGDSIIKPKGSLQLIIKNEFKSDTLDYEQNKSIILTDKF